LLLLRAGGFQESSPFRISQQLRIRPGAAISGNFVVFHALRSRDQTRVANVTFLRIGNEFIALLEQTFHPDTSARALIRHYQPESFRGARPAFRLVEVLIEGRASCRFLAAFFIFAAP